MLDPSEYQSTQKNTILMEIKFVDHCRIYLEGQFMQYYTISEIVSKNMSQNFHLKTSCMEMFKEETDTHRIKTSLINVKLFKNVLWPWLFEPNDVYIFLCPFDLLKYFHSGCIWHNLNDVHSLTIAHERTYQVFLP